MRDYYDVLGLTAAAGADEIRRAYRQLSRRCHPDISGDDRAASSIDDRGAACREEARAYEVLRDADRRHSRDEALGDSGPRVDWLSDEIAIDFPSVSSVLDGMRHSFFGDMPYASLSADVEVTPHEAFFGAVVPLEVPLRGTCATCGGRGEMWEEWCAPCAGTGEVTSEHPLRLRVPPGVREGARFRFSVMPAGCAPTLVEVRISVR